MAKSLGKRNGTARGVRDFLRSRNLSLCLGRSNSDIINNSPEGNNDANDNSMFAQKILAKDIKTVVHFGATETKYWKTGLAPHAYQSDGTANGQYLFVSGGILFMCVGTPGVKNRIDKDGALLTTTKPTRIDGGIETTADGISWMAINAIDGFDQLSNRYQEIAPFEQLQEEVNSTTSLSTKAKQICGAGTEGRTGNCCLYYGESGYDPIGGSTYAAGQFYKCLCSKCYRCIEMAEALDMRYVFNKFDPSGCTTCGCTGCDGENYPTDCGPCGCTIDWNENSYYTSVINDKHVTPTTSALGRNARIINEQEVNLSGAVLSASIDLSSIPIEARTITYETYDTKIKDGTFYLPIRAGSLKEEAYIPISVVRDGVSGLYYIDGFEEPKERGSGYTSAIVDTVVWGQIFPNWSGDVNVNDIVKITTTPIGGMAKHLDEILELSTLFHVVVNANDISDTFKAVSTGTTNTPKGFDYYAIQELYDTAGAPIYSGLGPNATNFKSLVPLITVSPVTGIFSPSVEGLAELPKANEVMHNSERLVTTGNKNIYTDTTLNNLVAYDSERRGSTEVRVPLQTSYAKDLVGKTLCVVTNIDDTAAKLSMNVESVYYNPKSNGNDDIDFTKTKTLFRQAMTLNFDIVSTQSVVSLEILYGQDQGIGKVTTS
jgi:hypothetical protein